MKSILYKFFIGLIIVFFLIIFYFELNKNIKEHFSDNSINISVYLLCYNEEFLIKDTILHYRNLFPNCNIIIYDNESTDNSVKIAKENNCKVINYNSGDRIDDSKYLQIKNNCWKGDENDWVVVADMDEWLFITPEQLLEEQNNGTTILLTEWYDVFLNDDYTNIQTDSTIGTLCGKKDICFNKKKITEINYETGAHNCKPDGIAKYSEKKYLVKHMNHLTKDYYVKKIKARWERNKENSKKGWGTHYISDEEKIKKDYDNEKEKSVKIPPL